ncbi:respiratory chain complex I subunit 1 family protein [Edaphobacter aggregans]|uniref:respiratory chain complex I subunit 1 family protein n=1 Tax=Edaphobacter aggregans TaxID=570835 RepID=UPI000555DDA0|nr:complex I subunit 1 family protein [Edaphobacter aggregans]
MNAVHALAALLVFPGVLYALPMGWLMMGAERKLRARFQGRIGPPLIQPFYDFVKLAAKWPVARALSDRRIMALLPLLAVGTTLGALALLPVFPNERGFSGDLILLVGLLEMPPLCMVLAGYASRSIYGEMGATREAIIDISCNVSFFAALIAMSTGAGSLHMTVIALATPWQVRLPALLAILICLPVKLRLNPFSIANAEQEVLTGPLVESEGRLLAIWELAHALEWVALIGFVVTLAIPYRSGVWWLDALLFAACSLVMVMLLTLLASAMGRLKLRQATRLIWRYSFVLATVALATAFLHRGN